jgi:uncharacterized membrane protein YagU involved in acid resistance
MHNLLRGAAAGTAATVPMTAAMTLLQRELPSARRQPLPPRQITVRVAREVGLAKYLGPAERTAATAVAHFGYGAAAGALYGAIAPALPGPPLGKGIAFGLAVWAGSYLGWLPAAGILRPATHEPAGRNTMMIAAHVVWGAVLGLCIAEGRDRERRRQGRAQ